MYIVPIAWIYVAVMMAMAEATSTNGTVLGALITFVLYGLVPVGLVLYIMGTPGRKRKIREREAQEQADYLARQPDTASVPSIPTPDAGSQAAADPVAPMRKEL